MKSMIKALALGFAPMTAMALASAPAVAQTKVAVVDLQTVVGTSNAYTTARTQMQTTYKPQIDSFNARKAAIDADLKAKGTALETAVKAAAGKTSPALQTQYEAYQKAGQDGQAELQRLGAPIQLADAYVQEQIVAKLEQALKAAMTKAKVDIILKEEATESYLPASNLTPAVLAELNTLVPNVSITPPAGWRPGGQGQGQAPAAAAPANPSQQPQSR
ncbi:MAG: OmpH family outer membrane protein [Sphingobium sp.]